MSNEVAVVDEPIELIAESGFDIIRDLHNTVSNVDTPKSFVKNKMGTDYVEYSYMRSVADKYYPGWSWTIINTDNLGSEAFMVHGRLKWFEGGIWREGDMTAAHRIMQKRSGGGFVDVGNDIKSANTDCIKKAFNMYLNIADDVYRNQVVDLDENEKMLINEKMLKAGFDSKEIARIGLNITKGKVTQLNVDDLYKWIDDKSKTKKESKGK